MSGPIKVFVYRNLHRGGFSIRDAKTRRVIGHASELLIRDPEFVVSEKGRQRVLRTGVRNVHAGIVGYLAIEPKHFAKAGMQTWEQVYYNPFSKGYFCKVPSGREVWAANYALCQEGKVFV